MKTSFNKTEFAVISHIEGRAVAIIRIAPGADIKDDIELAVAEDLCAERVMLETGDGDFNKQLEGLNKFKQTDFKFKIEDAAGNISRDTFTLQIVAMYGDD